MRAAVLAAALFLAPAGAAGAGEADGLVARGAALAEARGCGGCHGARGVSEQPGVPSLAGQRAGFLATQLILFRERLRDVPAMHAPSEGLADEEVEALAVYHESIPAAHAPDGRRGPRDAALAARGAEASRAARCGVCHLADYAGQRQVPRLTAQREDYLAAALRGYRDGTRFAADTQMNAAVHGLDDATLDALAHHLAHAPVGAP